MRGSKIMLLGLVVLGVAACGATASDGLDGLFADIGFTIDVSAPDTTGADAAPEATTHDVARPDTADGSGEPASDVADAPDTTPDGLDADPEAVEVTGDSAAPDAPPGCSCGDGACVTVGCGETAFSCPDDCCVCGDGVCRSQACDETPETCPDDCALWVCGNGACEPGETLATCADDCADGSCGNGVCEEGEDPASCLLDCALPCGSCDDGDPCTLDGCDGATGACTHAPTPSTGGSDTSCDGLDDDCDGAIDEDYAPTATTCGSDLCAATGLLVCQAGALVDTCAPLPGQPEICNGQDDDCDGQLDETCPCPVRVFEGHAYEFCTAKAKWTTARDACGNHGGYHLATIGSAAENQWVAATAKTYSSEPWWVGLNDRDKEGTWRWTDDQAPTFTAWGSGEPNNAWGAEDCVDVLPGDATWNDEGCNSFLNFVCEHE